MFQPKPKTNKEAAFGATSIIGKGVSVSGNINTTADIRIDGNLVGNIKSSARVFIGADAVVEGDIEANQGDILGSVTGTVKVKEVLNLRGQGTLSGDIYTGKLEIEPTAIFNGHCYMTGSVVVEMAKEKNEKSTAIAK